VTDIISTLVDRRGYERSPVESP